MIKMNDVTEVKKYSILTMNPGLVGKYGPSQIWVVDGYLRGLVDLGTAKRAEILPSGGKGAQIRELEIELMDPSKKDVIDSTLRETYGAVPYEDRGILEDQLWARIQKEESDWQDKKNRTLTGRISQYLRKRS
jgi:hypothetical protein